MDKLVALRKEQALSEKVRNVSYETLLAPFYFKAGDFLANYILMNTDELGTVRPFQEEAADSEDADAEVDNSEALPQEETKVEEEVKAEPTTMMINTTATNQEPVAAPKEAGENNGEGEGYEQEALNYLTLSLQILSDFTSPEGTLSGEAIVRKSMTAFLEIDTLLSRVQLFNHAPDYKSALEDLILVEALCVQFPE